MMMRKYRFFRNRQMHLCLSIGKKPRIHEEPLYLFAEALAVRELSAGTATSAAAAAALLTLPWLHLYGPFDAATSDPDPALTSQSEQKARVTMKVQIRR
jgi:hypothetical protein